MTSSIKAVIFDQGGVLSRGGEKGANESAAAQAMGLEAVEAPDLIEALKRGQIDNAQFVDGINRLYPNAPKKLTNAMWDIVYASLKPEPLSYEFVRTCKNSGRRVGLLSNINPAMAELLRVDGSYDDFDPLVLSCYAGCAKPDPAIYAIVEAGLPGIKPGEILLLDDQDKCVNGAHARGWQALKVTSPEQMVRDASTLLGF